MILKLAVILKTHQLCKYNIGSTEGVSILKVTEGTGSPESFNLGDGLDGQRLTIYSSG